MTDSTNAANVTRERFRLFSVGEILDLRPTDWLIEGIMGDGTQAVLYGPSGEGKSFLALDWALSVAAGRTWFGRQVHRGPVVYVVAEGGGKIGRRVRAWMNERDLAGVEDAFFILDAVQLRSGPDVPLLLQRIEGLNLRPRLIVLDTFARCSSAGKRTPQRTSVSLSRPFSASRAGRRHQCCWYTIRARRRRTSNGAAVPCEGRRRDDPPAQGWRWAHHHREQQAEGRRRV